MRIYHISSAPFSGGAARAAFRLHEGLRREPNIESTWLDTGTGAVGPGIIALESRKKDDSILKRLHRRKWGRIVSHHFTSTTPPASNPIGWGGIEMLEQLPVPDIWNLHWVSWFLDWETMLPWMAERAPIVWTLHDLNPLRGIWHYEPLPVERTPERLRFESQAMEFKKRVLSKIPKDRLTFVGPSKWMVEECHKSTITEGFRVAHIPNGLDTDVFKVRDPSQLREMFCIPKEAIVIGFIADNINDPRKGGRLLMEAIHQLHLEIPDIHLVTVGNGDFHCQGVAHTSLGSIVNDRLISFFYSACDIFVCPSLQDNLPNTVLESLSCGTPVVAYNLGGLPDMIESETGKLADPSGGSYSLKESLAQSLKSEIFSPSAIRQNAESRYALHNQASAYLAHYKSY